MEVLGTVPQMSNDISCGLRLQRDRARAARRQPARGIVSPRLLFGALRTGGGLMQVKTGIPLDLLFFIQALVIMFVAAPGLVRAIWRFDPRKKAADSPDTPSRRDTRRPTPKGAPHDRRDAAFSEHAPTRTPAPQRAARRAARIRGVVLAALGLFAFQLALATFETPAKFSFWIDKQGGDAVRAPDHRRPAVDRDRRRHRRVRHAAALPRRVVPVAPRCSRSSSRCGSSRPSRPCSTARPPT